MSYFHFRSEPTFLWPIFTMWCKCIVIVCVLCVSQCVTEVGSPWIIVVDTCVAVHTQTSTDLFFCVGQAAGLSWVIAGNITLCWTAASRACSTEESFFPFALFSLPGVLQACTESGLWHKLWNQIHCFYYLCWYHPAQKGTACTFIHHRNFWRDLVYLWVSVSPNQESRIEVWNVG